MNVNSTGRFHGVEFFRHLATPALALLCGAMVYLFTRDLLPELLLPLRDILHVNTPVTAPISLPFSGQLPSFFHAFAFLLVTRTLTQRDPAWQTPAWFSMLALIITMELLQLKWVEQWISTSPEIGRAWPLEHVVAYARSGTFDPLDLVAIGLATVLVELVFKRRVPATH